MPRDFDKIEPTRLEEACRRASDKLGRIIAREGDGNGCRLEPAYIRCLIEEQLKEMEAAEKLGIKNRGAAKADTPTDINTLTNNHAFVKEAICCV